jgi:hypothetical protein
MDLDPIYDSENSKYINFCSYRSTYSLWLSVVVHGWPRQEWEAAITARNDENYRVDPPDMIRYLVETVAAQNPNATVEFLDVSFKASHVHGAFKRLLPPRRREPLRVVRRDAESLRNQPYFNLRLHFVAPAMRNRGNRNNASLFISQLNDVMEILKQLGIRDSRGANESLINTLIAEYERLGREGKEAIIELGRAEMEEATRLAAAAAQDGGVEAEVDRDHTGGNVEE